MSNLRKIGYFGEMFFSDQVSRYQKKHSPIYTYRDHQSSLILLPQSIMIHGILSVQFTCLTVFFTISHQVFFGLPLGLAPSTSYSIYFFTQSLSSFRSTCPHHRSLFCCSTEIMSSKPSLPLNSLLGTLSCSLTPHIHLPAEVPPHFPN